MNKNEEKIQNDLSTYHIEKALAHLRLHEQGYQCYLADFVCALCGVEKKDMMSGNNSTSVQARWLYWLSYRYMTNESYKKIASMTEPHKGKRFSIQGVAVGVNKMSQLVESEPMWKKRWTIIKRIIKQRDNNNNNAQDTDNTIVVQVPKELRDNINIIIKEK